MTMTHLMVREYLALGHKKIESNCGLKIYNLGTGRGYSVLEVVKAFEKASGGTIRHKIVDRRSIHVDPTDLALGILGHVIAALKKIESNCGLKIYNLGTGRGYSVLQVVKAFEKASGGTIRHKIVDRRAVI